MLQKETSKEAAPAPQAPKKPKPSQEAPVYRDYASI